MPIISQEDPFTELNFSPLRSECQAFKLLPVIQCWTGLIDILAASEVPTIGRTRPGTIEGIFYVVFLGAKTREQGGTDGGKPSILYLDRPFNSYFLHGGFPAILRTIASVHGSEPPAYFCLFFLYAPLTWVVKILSYITKSKRT